MTRWAIPVMLVAIGALMSLPTGALAASTTIEAESMSLADSGVHVFADTAASGGKALNFTSNDEAVSTVTTGSATMLKLRARGDQCQGAPEAVVTIDGVAVFTILVPATTWTEYTTTIVLAAGTHSIMLSYDNDAYVAGVCDRNLRVDDLVLSGEGSPPPPPPIPPAPTGLVATPGNAQVALAWNAVTSVGLAGYDVYRGTTSGGPYTKVTGSPVTSPAYTDTTAVNGTTYYYVVEATNTAAQSSANSNEVSARPVAPTGGGSTTIEAESMALEDSGVHVFTDPLASGGKALNFTTNDAATTTVSTVAATTLILRARGDQCQGAPEAIVTIDGVKRLTVLVPATAWTDYSTAVSLAAGTHKVQVTYDNDLYAAGTCDRNLRVDRLVLSSSGGSATPLLPDMVQQPPSQVSVVQSSASYRLGFNSGVQNEGQGPLIINGHRPNTSSTMVADQILHMSDGSTKTVAGIGSMIFYVPHNHWHYLGFDHYELRNASDNSFVAPDQKMGFCLGDRYTPNSDGSRTEPPKVAGPYTFINCAVGETGALGVTEGISVGYGDDYTPQLEGQYIDVTGVQPGQYVLVHRANEDHSIQETNYANDVASVLVNLWPHGYGSSPGVEVLRTCPASETCPAQGTQSLVSAAAGGSLPASLLTPGGRGAAATPTVGSSVVSTHAPNVSGNTVPIQLIDPPQLLPRTARYFATQAIGRALGGSPTLLQVMCKRRSTIRYACRVAFHEGSSRYAGTVTVALPPRNAEHWWSYDLTLARDGNRCDGRETRCPGTVIRSARVQVKTTLRPLVGLEGLPLYLCHPPAGKSRRSTR